MSYEQFNNRMIAKLVGVNLNSTADQAMVMFGAVKYIIRRIIATNVSTDISLGLAAGGIYTGAGKTGTTVVGVSQVYTGLTGSTKFVDLTLAAAVTTDVVTATTLFFSLTTANGSAATADIYVFGETLT